MINVLVSGEGKTDMGEINYPYSDLSDIKKGPMIYLIEQIIQKTKNQEVYFGLIAKSQLTQETKKLKTRKFPSKRSGKKTAIFYKNAYVFGKIAIEKQYDIAIFFRDADSTKSGISPDWQERVNSILQGFIDSGFKNGVAMVPKPHPNKNIQKKIGKKPTLKTLIKIVDEQCDTDKMDMPSFQNFKINLESVIKA